MDETKPDYILDYADFIIQLNDKLSAIKKKYRRILPEHHTINAIFLIDERDTPFLATWRTFIDTHQRELVKEYKSHSIVS